MSSELLSPANSRDVILSRTFVIIFGLIGVIWGLVNFPIFWRAASIEHIAKRVIAGEPFKIGILTGQVPIIESIEKSEYCYPAGIRSAVIIRLRIVEAMTSAGEGDKIDTQMKSLGNSMLTSLTCSPADPFLWLALYSMDSARNGFTANQLKYLHLSYQVGPNEGWIGLKRNSIALTNFEWLPADLKEAAITEFIGLVNSGFYREAATLFIGPGWREQELILARLKEVAGRNRQAFADALYRQGFNLKIPGTSRPDPRAWH